jgi:hypothetical protein
MAIVARGLGQPEDGALVAGGLGTSEPAPAGSISATIAGTSSLTAELTAATPSGAMAVAIAGTSSLTAVLTATGVQPGQPSGGNTSPWLSFKRGAIAGEMSARLAGSSFLTADLDFSIDFDAELEQLLLIGAL